MSRYSGSVFARAYHVFTFEAMTSYARVRVCEADCSAYSRRVLFARASRCKLSPAPVRQWGSWGNASGVCAHDYGDLRT
jgi:hypothetical protein